jgi:hypothetical protein
MKYFRLIDSFNTDFMNRECDFMDTITVAVKTFSLVPRFTIFGIELGNKYQETFEIFTGSFIYYSQSYFLYMLIGNEIKNFPVGIIYYAPSRAVIFEKINKKTSHLGNIEKPSRDPYFINVGRFLRGEEPYF